MNEITYTYYNCGLGTTLSIISVMIHIPNPVVFRSNALNIEFLNRLLCIFKIPNSVIRCEIDNSINESPSQNNDNIKILSPYYKPGILSLFGKDVPINKGKKPCALLSKTADATKNYGTFSDLCDENPGFPNNRYYSLEEYSKIFSLLSRAGYDVITLDDRLTTPIEKKVDIMNSMCDVFIGYEGGLAHLSHMLQIPSIILPWHHSPSGELYDVHHCAALSHAKILHIDDNVYFVDNIDQCLNWDTDEFLSIVDSLKNKKGNHPALDNTSTLTLDDGFVFFNNHRIHFPPTELSLNFLLSHLPEFKLGGKFTELSNEEILKHKIREIRKRDPFIYK